VQAEAREYPSGTHLFTGKLWPPLRADKIENLADNSAAQVSHSQQNISEFSSKFFT